MNTIKVTVPEGISYLSDWEGFFEAFPDSHYILNKRLCGCGATEAYIRSSKKIILASPRKHLLLDKFKQHQKDNLHLFRWNGSEEQYLEGKTDKQDLVRFISNLNQYVHSGGTKILTTYDSIHHIKEVLNQNEREQWVVVCDEWQCLFHDCSFKPDTELNFCYDLQNFKTVVFLSATPYMSDYLDAVEFFKDLPIYELQWQNSKMVKPDIRAIKAIKPLEEHLKAIIDDYRGEGKEFVINGKSVISKEVVIFLNNVHSIIKAIKSNKLKPEEVNIICSSTSANKRDITKELGKKFQIGTIPLKNEPCKKYTFCTATTYVGADFYSTSAYTYIFANPEIESMRIDTALDLQQILGRQRLDSNPFRNMATLYYWTKSTSSDLRSSLKEKEDMTMKLLKNYQAAPYKTEALATIETIIKTKDHGNSYCSIVKDADNKFTVCRNELLVAADKRAFDILNNIYRNEFTMCIALGQHSSVTQQVDSDNPKIQEIYEKWWSFRYPKDKAQYYCECCKTVPDILAKCDFIPIQFRRFYDILGEEGMKVLGWSYKAMELAIKPNPFTPLPKDKIAAEFIKRVQSEKVMSKEEAKNILQEIYREYEININAKASDLDDYFTCKDTTQTIKKKKVASIEIVSYNRMKVSLFPSITKPDNAKNYTVDGILDIIKDSSYFKVKEKVEKVRSSQSDKDRASAKLQLPAVTWNGTFKTKHQNDLISYSSFAALDFDKIPQEKMSDFKHWLEGFDCVYAYFQTPSGNGYKAIILHNNYYPEYHFDLYTQLLKKFDCPELDKSTSDLARGNYLSYDPDLWINPHPTAFDFHPSQKEPLQPTQTYTTVKNEQSGKEERMLDQSSVSYFINKLCFMTIPDESVINMLNKIWSKKPIAEGERNNRAMSYAGILCKAGVDKVKAQHYLEGLIPNFDVAERIDYAYSHNDFGCNRYRYQKRKH